MLACSQRAKIIKCDPEIEKAYRKNNTNTRTRKMVTMNVGQHEHTLHDYLTLSLRITASIQLSDLEDQTYELRHGLVNMIKRMQFNGRSSEDHVVHLKKFLRLTDTVKSSPMLMTTSN